MQGIAVVMVMVMVTTILNVSATKRRTLVMDAVQRRVPRMATAAATTAQPLQRKTRRTMGAHLASVKERAWLKNHKNRVLPLVTSMIAVRVLNTQGGASAQEDHSAMETLRYNTASDVWSFGVTVFEIYSNGARPYGAMDSNLGTGCRSLTVVQIPSTESWHGVGMPTQWRGHHLQSW